jgi:hypothetical protein
MLRKNVSDQEEISGEKPQLLSRNMDADPCNYPGQRLCSVLVLSLLLLLNSTVGSLMSGLTLKSHCWVLCTLRQMTLSLVVIEFSCMENRFLHVSLEMEVWLLKNG